MTQRAVLYGGSLYDLVAEEGNVQEVWEQMQAVAGIFRENPDYGKLLATASLSKQERTKLLQEAFGDSIQKYLLNFLKLLCERDLLGEYNGCCEEYKRRFYQDNNIAEACVTSAVALSEAQQEALCKKLEQTTGKKIALVQRIDTAVVAGMRVEIDGKLLDGTVQSRMQGISRKLNETIY